MAPKNKNPRITTTRPPAPVKPTYNPSIIFVENLHKHHRYTYPKLKPADLIASVLHRIDPKFQIEVLQGNGFPDLEVNIKLKKSSTMFTRSMDEITVERYEKVANRTEFFILLWVNGAWQLKDVEVTDHAKDLTTGIGNEKEKIQVVRKMFDAMITEKIWQDPHCVNYHYRFGDDDADSCREYDEVKEDGKSKSDEKAISVVETDTGVNTGEESVHGSWKSTVSEDGSQEEGHTGRADADLDSEGGKESHTGWTDESDEYYISEDGSNGVLVYTPSTGSAD